MSAVAASVVVTVWTIPRVSLPTCTFMPKYHWLPFRVCFMSGSRVCVAFFVELGAAMIVASTIVSALSKSLWSASNVRTVASYEVEIQKKLALAAACVVLALLAAGITSRASRLSIWAQGGISLVVFGGYYVCIIAGEHLADRSAISPASAMWSANIIVMMLAVITLPFARGGRAPEVRPPSPTV
jgi:Lipopolysaccharide export system permease LptF/LptG